MAYDLSWYLPQKLLHLTLDGQMQIQELQTINREVLDILEAQSKKISIIIDATNFRTGYKSADELGTTQKYMDHLGLDTAYIVTNNKLTRLITLMAFCISRTKLVQFDTIKDAENDLKRRGFMQGSQV